MPISNTMEKILGGITVEKNTDNINSNNFNSIRAQILSKRRHVMGNNCGESSASRGCNCNGNTACNNNNFPLPFYATKNMAKSVITDQDSFPYKRYFRGQYKSDRPIIMEREAGYRPRDDSCYNQSCVGARMSPCEDMYPRNCFEAAGSIVYPCYPETLRRYADKAEMEVMLNDECIVLTR